jgi:hypothetical protein
MQAEVVFVPAPTKGIDLPGLGHKCPVTTDPLEDAPKGNATACK